MKWVKKKWGNEKWIVNTELYCLKLMTVLPEHSCSFHAHSKKTETFYITEGALELHISKVNGQKKWKTVILKRGQQFTLKPNQYHRFNTKGSGWCRFYEVSTHHSDDDVMRLTESY